MASSGHQAHFYIIKNLTWPFSCVRPSLWLKLIITITFRFDWPRIKLFIVTNYSLPLWTAECTTMNAFQSLNILNRFPTSHEKYIEFGSGSFLGLKLLHRLNEGDLSLSWSQNEERSSLEESLDNFLSIIIISHHLLCPSPWTGVIISTTAKECCHLNINSSVVNWSR